MHSTSPVRYHRKGCNTHRSPQRSSLHTLQTIPRPVRLLVIGVVLICGFAGFLQGRTNYLDQLKKFHPTDFSRLHAFNSPLWPPSNPVRHTNGTHIDDDFTYIHHLGKGQEGSVALYSNGDGLTVTIKTFSVSARNLIPAELAGDFIQFTTTWPTEIEAGLLLNTLSESSFVPVLDYFVLEEPAGWTWALVSPFELGGTLQSLAARERAASHSNDPSTLDRAYRSSLKGLLSALENLHLAGICHDDIKPDNVFIDRDQQHWILGDLGNVREIKHPWHKTASWNRQNQLSDCKTNDVKRALKTYLWFLRDASTEVDAFDKQFWEGKHAWSRMYWDFANHAVDAGRLARLSDALYSHDQEHDANATSDISGGHDLRETTTRELTCTTLPRRLWLN